MPPPALAQIRDVLTSIFSAGLQTARPDLFAKLRALFETSGYARSVAMIDELAAEKDAAGRFRSFTKLLLAIRQLELATMPAPRLKAGGFVVVPALRGFAVPQTYADQTPEAIKTFLDTKRLRVPGYYLIADKLEGGKLGVPELIPMLSHGFYREAGLAKLRALGDERRETLAAKLVTIKNRPVRRAGVSLFTTLGARVSAMKGLLQNLADPAVARETAAAFAALGHRSTNALSTTVDSPDDAVREAAAKLMRQIADPKAEGALRRMVNDKSPAVRAWAKLGSYSIGSQGLDFVKALAADADPLTRIYAKAELVKAGQAPSSKLTEELGEGGWKNYKFTIPAIAELPNAEIVLEPILDKFTGGTTREQRRQAFEMLQHLPVDKFRRVFEMAAGDCDPDIARKGLDLLIRQEGFRALDDHVDLRAVLTKPYADMTGEEKEHALARIFPYVAEVGDVRFVPYLVGLIRDRCFAGPSIEFTYSLRPALVEFNVPLVPALKQLAQDPHSNIAGAAREVLTEIGPKV